MVCLWKSYTKDSVGKLQEIRAMSKNDRYVVKDGDDWDGKWRDSDTVPPGNDPFPPRDKKH